MGKINDLKTIFNQINLKYQINAQNTEWASSTLVGNQASIQGIQYASNAVPNVKGMGLKDAVSLLESKGLNVVVSGRGRVVSQSINEGSQFIKGQKIILMLN